MHEHESGQPTGTDAKDGLTAMFDRGWASVPPVEIGGPGNPTAFPGTASNAGTTVAGVDREVTIDGASLDPENQGDEVTPTSASGFRRLRIRLPRWRRRERAPRGEVPDDAGGQPDQAAPVDGPKRRLGFRPPKFAIRSRQARVGLAAMISVSILVVVLIYRKHDGVAPPAPGASTTAVGGPRETLEKTRRLDAKPGPSDGGAIASSEGVVPPAPGAGKEPTPPIPMQVSPGSDVTPPLPVFEGREGTARGAVQLAMVDQPSAIVPPQPATSERIELDDPAPASGPSEVIPPLPVEPGLPSPTSSEAVDIEVPIPRGMNSGIQEFDPAPTPEDPNEVSPGAPQTPGGEPPGLPVDAFELPEDLSDPSPEPTEALGGAGGGPEPLNGANPSLAWPSESHAGAGATAPSQPPGPVGDGPPAEDSSAQLPMQEGDAAFDPVGGPTPGILDPNTGLEAESTRPPVLTGIPEGPSAASGFESGDPMTTGAPSDPPAGISGGSPPPSSFALPAADEPAVHVDLSGPSIAPGTAAVPGEPTDEAPAAVEAGPPSLPNLAAPPDTPADAGVGTPTDPNDPPVEDGLTPLPNRGLGGIPVERPLGGHRPVETVPVPSAAAPTTFRAGDARPRAELSALPHVVQSGENFFTISRLYYGSGRYWKALWAANRQVSPAPTDLTVGTTIQVPPPERLDGSLIAVEEEGLPESEARTRQAFRKDAQLSRTGEGAGDRVLLPSSDAGELGPGAVLVPEPAEPAARTYLVRGEHETLRSVARDALGDPRREGEIRRMNLDRVDETGRLHPGLRLRLPADAGPTRLR